MELLQSLLDTSSHAIFTLDREGIITHINQQAKNRFGLYNHSQHSHQNIADLNVVRQLSQHFN